MNHNTDTEISDLRFQISFAHDAQAKILTLKS